MQNGGKVTEMDSGLAVKGMNIFFNIILGIFFQSFQISVTSPQIMGRN